MKGCNGMIEIRLEERQAACIRKKRKKTHTQLFWTEYTGILSKTKQMASQKVSIALFCNSCGSLIALIYFWVLQHICKIREK